MSQDTNPDILGMSDEEFAKLPEPTDVVVEPVKPQDPPVAPPAVTKDETEDETQDNTQTGEDDTAVVGQSEADDKTGDDEASETPAGDPPTTESTPPAGDLPGDPAKPVTKAESEEGESDPEPKDTGKADYEAFYKQIMAPFKANGKTIQLQSADEVISLMQMGANFTKKMQAIQSHKKYLMMLEQNGLLDENKLSFYIDLEKKNPEAIKKFLKDAEIDPVDFDTSAEVNYKSGSHAVTDQEANLATAIEELNSMTNGKETLQSVNAWDSASKKVLYENPEILGAIHTQRENGIYSRITAEMERRKVLGQVAPNVPFLQAYKTIGDELAAKGVFQSSTQPAPSGQQPVQVRTPVTVRPAKTPGTKAADASKVRAAAATRSVSRPAKASVNVLAMSDEEFLKFADKV